MEFPGRFLFRHSTVLSGPDAAEKCKVRQTNIRAQPEKPDSRFFRAVWRVEGAPEQQETGEPAAAE
jgi:hypothetical protein